MPEINGKLSKLENTHCWQLPLLDKATNLLFKYDNQKSRFQAIIVNAH